MRRVFASVPRHIDHPAVRSDSALGRPLRRGGQRSGTVRSGRARRLDHLRWRVRTLMRHERPIRGCAWRGPPPPSDHEAPAEGRPARGQGVSARGREGSPHWPSAAGRSPCETDASQLTSDQGAAAPISWLPTAAVSHPSQADAREFLRPAPRRLPRPERVCRQCGNRRHVQRRPPHDRLRRQSRPTNQSRSPMPRLVPVPDRRLDRRELRSRGTSRLVVGQGLRPLGCRQQGRSQQTELSSWTRHVGRSALSAGRQPPDQRQREDFRQAGDLSA
jgi:hypothetical protein